jgi:hypothetical protein
MLWTQGPCHGHKVHAVDVGSMLTTLGSMRTLTPCRAAQLEQLVLGFQFPRGCKADRFQGPAPAGSKGQPQQVPRASPSRFQGPASAAHASGRHDRPLAGADCYFSPTSPLHLPYISPTSRLYLPPPRRRRLLLSCRRVDPALVRRHPEVALRHRLVRLRLLQVRARVRVRARARVLVSNVPPPGTSSPSSGEGECEGEG